MTILGSVARISHAQLSKLLHAAENAGEIEGDGPFPIGHRHGRNVRAFSQMHGWLTGRDHQDACRKAGFNGVECGINGLLVRYIQLNDFITVAIQRAQHLLRPPQV
jgi:hypothetical protein